MSDRLILIDTSAWINHLTGASHAPSRAIEELLQAHRAATNAVVRVELLTGARDDTQYAELDDTLQGLHMLNISDVVWRRAERLRFELKQLGRIIPVPDVLMAACALVYDCALLHRDRHFELIAQRAPLRLHHVRGV